MKAGTQVVYVPTLAAGDITDPHCHRGFVAGNDRLGQTALVFFWHPEAIGVRLRPGRPVAADVNHLVAADSCEQGVVDRMLGIG